MMKEGNLVKPPVFPAPATKRRRSSLPILILAVLFVSATFLTWYYTWFGRDLSDQEISKYLEDEKHPRHVQHALLQIEQRLDQSGGQCCRQWYAKIQELAANPETEFRMTTAWLMGYDNRSEQFHQSLLTLLNDKEPMVRRNAALALVRFNDSSGHADLLTILKPFPVTAPVPGVITSTLNEGAQVSRGTLLARIQEANGTITEIRSPIAGRIEGITSPNASKVELGTPVLSLSSDASNVWEALRGLALIGKPDDLSEIERYVQGVGRLPERIKQQAALTAKAIQSRATQQGQNGQAIPGGDLTQ